MWSESHELFGTSDEDDAAQPKKEDECEVYEPDAEAGVEEQVAEETRDAVACLPECTPSDSEQEESSEDDDTKTNNKKGTGAQLKPMKHQHKNQQKKDFS